jgi:hypothetical protein
MTTTPRTNLSPQAVVGLAIMALGALLALNVLEVASARVLLRYWPALLVAAGVLIAMQSTDRGGMMTGGLMAFFGTWLLLTTLHVLPSHSWRLFWPLVLIVAGAMLVLHTARRDPDGPRLDPSETVNIVGILGGGNRVSAANPFRGGELMAFMGGGKIDLRQAIIPPGEQAFLDVWAVMGGFEILIPQTWTVDDRTLPVMGGIGNETRSQPGASASLVIRGFLLMGGVTLRN